MLEQYHSINEAAGVSITLLQDGSMIINASSVIVKDNRLTIEKKLTGVLTIEQFAKQIPAKSIIALNLSGKGVLQKQVEKIEAVDHHNFSKVLPNANMDDFYVQNFISGEYSFVTVIRKTEADKWTGQLESNGLIPVMLSLGPFPVQHIVPQLNIYDNDMIFNGCTIKRDEQLDWTSCQYDASALSPFPLKLESETIHEKLLVPYAAAFQVVLAHKMDPIRAEVPALEAAFQKLVEEKKLKVTGFVILCAVFVLLLINFLLFSWLTSSNAQLTGQVSRSVQSTEDIQKINGQVQQKETLLKTLGWEGGINKSALIDQVAALLPPEVTWRAAAIDPVDLSGSRTQKSIVFADRSMRIAGDAQKIIPVNEWIARIKTKPWVKNVQLDSYTFNNELNTGQFMILIDY
jgi:Tfp pilus assembly protein PilN